MRRWLCRTLVVLVILIPSVVWVAVSPVYASDSGEANDGDDIEVVENPAPSYICPAGYSQTTSGNNQCAKALTETPAASSAYSCPSGYTRSGTQCSRTVSTSIKETTGYSCPSDYARSGTQCVTILYASVVATTVYSCASGWTLSGTECTKTISAPGLEITTTSCPSGYTLTGNVCDDGNGNTVSPTVTTSYGCPAEPLTGWTVTNGICYLTETTEATTSTSYRCPSGYTRVTFDTCQNTVTIDTTVTISSWCPSGYTPSGTLCSQTLTTSATTTRSPTATRSATGTTNSAGGSTSFSCTDGLTLLGGPCFKTEQRLWAYSTTCRSGVGLRTASGGLSYAQGTCGRRGENQSDDPYPRPDPPEIPEDTTDTTEQGGQRCEYSGFPPYAKLVCVPFEVEIECGGPPYRLPFDLCVPSRSETDPPLENLFGSDVTITYNRHGEPVAYDQQLGVIGPCEEEGEEGQVRYKSRQFGVLHWACGTKSEAEIWSDDYDPGPKISCEHLTNGIFYYEAELVTGGLGFGSYEFWDCLPHPLPESEITPGVNLGATLKHIWQTKICPVIDAASYIPVEPAEAAAASYALMTGAKATLKISIAGVVVEVGAIACQYTGGEPFESFFE